MHKFFFCTYAKFSGKKKSFFRKFFFATGLIFERFLAPRSRFFEKVNGLGVLGFSFLKEYDTNDWLKICYTVTHSFSVIYDEDDNYCVNSQTVNFFKKPTSGAKNRSNTSPVAKQNSEKMIFFQKLCICAKKKLHTCTFSVLFRCIYVYFNMDQIRNLYNSITPTVYINYLKPTLLNSIRRRLRPPPPKVDARMVIAGLVDVWHNEGWWVERYTRREGDNYIVVFDQYPNQEYSYARQDLRFHHEWSPVTDRKNQTANRWFLGRVMYFTTVFDPTAHSITAALSSFTTNNFFYHIINVQPMSRTPYVHPKHRQQINLIMVKYSPKAICGQLTLNVGAKPMNSGTIRLTIMSLQKGIITSVIDQSPTDSSSAAPPSIAIRLKPISFDPEEEHDLDLVHQRLVNICNNLQKPLILRTIQAYLKDIILCYMKSELSETHCYFN
ncbi:hypothetical protein LXL04_030163 [Taraxacum kok-saghyz]